MSNPIIPGAEVNGEHNLELPQDQIAERSVLGGMMLAADAIDDVVKAMSSTDFYRPAHQTIYETILDLYGSGAPTDAVAVAAELEKRGELTRVGGGPYLHTLVATVPTAANAGYYAEIVADKAARRRLITAGMQTAQLGWTGEDGAEVSDLVARAQSALDAVTNGTAANSGYTLLSDMRPTELSALDDLQAGRIEPGLPTGIIDLDQLISGGWRPGQMVVVAGRPGMGKSTLAVDMVRAASIRGGKTSAIFSLEMSASEIWQRIVCAEAKVRLQDLKKPGALTPRDQDRITDALDRAAAGGPIVLDDRPGMTMATIRANARRIKRTLGLHLVVIDYLQLMSSGKRVESRQLEVAEFSRQVKLLAKELEVPIIAVSQLNRGLDQRADKRPMLSDLRESGALEQDSDVVLFVHRPEVYEPEGGRLGEADLIVAKHRGGPTGQVTVAQQLQFCRFADLATP